MLCGAGASLSALFLSVSAEGIGQLEIAEEEAFELEAGTSPRVLSIGESAQRKVQTESSRLAVPGIGKNLNLELIRALDLGFAHEKSGLGLSCEEGGDVFFSKPNPAGGIEPEWGIWK